MILRVSQWSSYGGKMSWVTIANLWLVGGTQPSTRRKGGWVLIEDLYNTSLALKTRWNGLLISEEDTVWILLAKEGIAHNLSLGFHRKTRRFQFTAEAILLDKNLTILAPHYCMIFLKGLISAERISCLMWRVRCSQSTSLSRNFSCS